MFKAVFFGAVPGKCSGDGVTGQIVLQSGVLLVWICHAQFLHDLQDL